MRGLGMGLLPAPAPDEGRAVKRHRCVQQARLSPNAPHPTVSESKRIWLGIPDVCWTAEGEKIAMCSWSYRRGCSPSNTLTPDGVMGVPVPWLARVKENDRADRLAGKATITSGLCLVMMWSVEKLEALPAGTRPKTITPSTAWRRQAWEEEALDDIPWKDERGLSSIRQTLELFQKQRWGNFCGTGWSSYGFCCCCCCCCFRADRYHLELNWMVSAALHAVWPWRNVQCVLVEL